jgi:hypothetical protein
MRAWRGWTGAPMRMGVSWRLMVALALTACGGGGGGGAPATSGPPGATHVVPEAVQFPGTANDLVWDEQRQVVYLSLPSSAGPQGNRIVALDPRTNAIVHSQVTGSEPSKLSMSDDGQYLYAGIDGRASVQRFKLPDLTPDLEIPLGADDWGGPYHAVDLLAVPGSPRAVVVARSFTSAPDSVSSTVVYDDAVARPLSLGLNCACGSLQWGDNGTQLYAADNLTTGFSFYDIQVGPSGLQLSNSVFNAFSEFGSRIHYARATRLLYADDGTVFDPVNRRRVTKMNIRGPMVADLDRNRLYFATGEGSKAITGVDATTYQRVGLARQFNEPAASASRMVRWGPEGIALATAGGAVHVFGGSGRSTFNTVVPVGSATQTLIPGTINSLVWDPVHARLYASVSSASATAPNSVLAIDPATGSVAATKFLGNEPNAMAVSDDGQFLYVGLDQTGTVQRLSLPNLELDISLSLGSHLQFGPYVAGHLKVAPGAPRTVAVSRFSVGVVPAEQGGVQVFDDAVPRPVVAPMLDASVVSYYDNLEWNADGSKLYSSNFLYGHLYTLAVDSSGPRLERTLTNAFPSPGYFHFNRANGLIYHDSGRVLDPATGRPTGVFRPAGYIGGEQLASDVAAHRVFVLSTIATSGANHRLDIFDLARYTPVISYPVNVDLGLAFNFVKMRANRFAFRSINGVYLVAIDLPP